MLNNRSDLFGLQNDVINDVHNDITKHTKYPRQITPDESVFTKPRYIHQSRSVKVREKDENLTKNVTKDIQLWRGNPSKYDLECIDDRSIKPIFLLPINKYFYKFSVREIPDKKSELLAQNLVKSMGKKKSYTLFRANQNYRDIIEKGLGEEIGYLKFHTYPSRKELYIDELWIDKKARSGCNASHLMREMTNLADKSCITTKLEASPIKDTDLKSSNFGNRIKSLVNFYSQFGFIPTDKVYSYNEFAIGQDMTRLSKC